MIVALTLFLPMGQAPPTDDAGPGPITPSPNSQGDRGDPSDDSPPSSQPSLDFDVDSDSGDGSVGVSVALPPGATTSTETRDSGPRNHQCSWRPVVQGDFRDSPGAVEGEQIVERGPDGEVIRRAFWRACGNSSQQIVWVAPQVDIGQLIDGAEARARAATPVPVPDINPPTTAGSFVNLGLWLAIEDPGPTVAQVGLGGQWARVQATHSRFETDFGNGDMVSCTGLGVPIVDLDTLEEGPCGYTYRLSSPEEDPYQITITSFYDVTYTTSTGRSGSLEGLSRSITFDYDIDEIQTVGTRN